MMYTMPKNLLSICVNFALATQRRADADRLHAVRPVHRFFVRQYELYAVGRTRPSGYRAVRAAAGSAAHSPAVSAECGFRSEWCSSRTVHHGLCHYCAVVRGLEKDSARIGAASIMEMNVMVQRVPSLTIHQHCRRGDQWSPTQRHIFNFPFSILNFYP